MLSKHWLMTTLLVFFLMIAVVFGFMAFNNRTSSAANQNLRIDIRRIHKESTHINQLNKSYTVQSQLNKLSKNGSDLNTQLPMTSHELNLSIKSIFDTKNSQTWHRAADNLSNKFDKESVTKLTNLNAPASVNSQLGKNYLTYNHADTFKYGYGKFDLNSRDVSFIVTFHATGKALPIATGALASHKKKPQLYATITGSYDLKNNKYHITKVEQGDKQTSLGADSDDE